MRPEVRGWMLPLATESVETGSAWTVDGAGRPGARRDGPEAAVTLALGVGALALGGIAGWMAATSPRVPSYNYAGAVAAFWGVLFLLGIVAIAVIGLLVLLSRRWWLTAAFVVGAGCLLGLCGGAWLTEALGLGYKTPPFPAISIVQNHARGEASARLDGVAGFTTHMGSADCTAGPGLVVATVKAWDLGALGDATFRGDLKLSVAGVDPGTANVSVHLWSSSMTGPGPRWQGTGRLTPVAGHVSFAHLVRVAGGQPTEGTWPAELSGEISWSCGPWSNAPATSGP